MNVQTERTPTMLHRAYEQLMVQATLDTSFCTLLLTDPCQAALNANCNPMLAESLVGLQSATLSDFAAALHERVYGYRPAQAHSFPTQYPFAARDTAAYAQ
jgi:hypothetical protein